MQDDIIINCKCGKKMLLDNEYERKNYNYRQRRFYCANCSNEIKFQFNFMKHNLPL